MLLREANTGLVKEGASLFVGECAVELSHQPRTDEGTPWDNHAVQHAQSDEEREQAKVVCIDY